MRCGAATMKRFGAVGLFVIWATMHGATPAVFAATPKASPVLTGVYAGTATIIDYHIGPKGNVAQKIPARAVLGFTPGVGNSTTISYNVLLKNGTQFGSTLYGYSANFNLWATGAAPDPDTQETTAFFLDGAFPASGATIKCTALVYRINFIRTITFTAKKQKGPGVHIATQALPAPRDFRWRRALFQRHILSREKRPGARSHLHPWIGRRRLLIRLLLPWMNRFTPQILFTTRVTRTRSRTPDGMRRVEPCYSMERPKPVLNF